MLAEDMRLLGQGQKIWSLTEIAAAEYEHFLVSVSQALIPTGWCEVGEVSRALTVGCIPGEEPCMYLGIQILYNGQ